MQRGYIILIAGAVLLVAGIAIAAVWGVSFASSFIANNTLVAKTTINPGQSVSAKTDVTQLGRPISLTVGLDKTTATTTTSGGGGVIGQQQITSTSNIKLKETITDPNGSVVSSSEFSDSLVTSFNPQVTGVYTVTITNLGTSPVSISGTFGYLPFITGSSTTGNPSNFNAMMGGAIGGELALVIVGGLMAIVGVITLIVGGIVSVVDSRARHGTTTTTTSEGGITYRKD